MDSRCTLFVPPGTDKNPRGSPPLSSPCMNRHSEFICFTELANGISTAVSGDGSGLVERLLDLKRDNKLRAGCFVAGDCAGGTARRPISAIGAPKTCSSLPAILSLPPVFTLTLIFRHCGVPAERWLVIILCDSDTLNTGDFVGLLSRQLRSSDVRWEHVHCQHESSAIFTSDA